MEYMTIKQAAERWGYSEEAIRKWCKENKLLAVVEAQKISGRWQIPVNAECPKPIRSRKL